MLTKNLRLLLILAGVALLLMVPLIASLFSSGFQWSPFDYLVAGVTLLGMGLVCEWVLRTFKLTRQRIIICAVLLVALALVWIELAVGIFNSPLAGN